MNIINVDINFTKGTLVLNGIDLITGDYASTEIDFTFDEEHSTGRKVFEMKSPSEELVFVNEIVDNKIILAGKDENENNVSLFDEEGYYIFEISYYDGDSKLTSVFGKLPVAQEQVVIGDEIVEPYLPIFDELVQEVDIKIAEMESAMQGADNLDIEAEKVDKTTTITITRKDGTTEEVEILDGLDGEKGEQGEPGVPGAVKFIIVNELPTEDIQTDAIYLVPSEEPTTQDLYLEYMYINNQWELLGQKQIVVDLSNYVQFTDYASSRKAGVLKNGLGFEVSNAGYLQVVTYSYSDYNILIHRYPISKGTLENVIAGKGLVSNTIIKNANSTTAGDVYDVRYINSLIGDIGTILDSINGESVGD